MGNVVYQVQKTAGQCFSKWGPDGDIGTNGCRALPSPVLDVLALVLPLSFVLAVPTPYPQPLTLECFDDDGCTVTVTDYGDLEYYQSDIKEWKEYTSDSDIQLLKGEWVNFRGTNATAGTGSSEYMNIKCNGNCYVYGNVMSLLDKDNFATMTTLPYDYTFQNLFKDNIYITNAEDKELVLPATVLTQNCYFQMFSGCTNLNYIKCLATDISASYCTYNWLYNVSRSGTFVKAAGFDGWTTDADDDSGIPWGWTVTTE